MNELDAERWERIDAILNQILELPLKERKAFLEQACSDDEVLRQEIEALLTDMEKSQADDFFDRGILGGALAARMLGMDDEKELVLIRPGDRIGVYEIVCELGRGGMGAVYLAERVDGQFEQKVALKITKHSKDSDVIRRRFLQERQILCRLQHPNIVRLLDGGVSEDRPYFAMEYVEGMPLINYCDEHKMGVEARLRLFQDVCLAVQYAHRNLIVHCDLKPSNILVTEEGEVKLLDFGIAKLLKEQTVSLTRGAMRVMTPEYTSPEQVKGKPVTTASDVYALGVILYELLAGHQPYRVQGLSPSRVERMVCEVNPTKPSMAISRVEEVSDGNGKACQITPETVSRLRDTQLGRLRRQLQEDLDAIVLRSLQKDPEQRYGSAEQLSEDIKRHLDGLPVLARKGTLSYHAGKFARRHWGKIAVSAAFVLFGIFYAVRVTQERDNVRVEAAKAQQIASFMIDLFEVSDPDEALGNTITARELLDQGAQTIHQELSEQPEVQAIMMNVMGEVYSKLGLYDEAEPLFRKALDIRRQEHGGTHEDIAESLDNLASLHVQKGEYDAAEKLFREALAMQRELHDEAYPALAETLNNLAELLKVKGEYDAAEALYREALAMRKKLHGEEHISITNLLNNLGGIAFRQGKYDAADSLFRESLAMRRQLLGEKHRLVAEGLNNRGVVLRVKGKYKEAEALYQEALDIWKTVLGQEHPRVALVLDNLGRLYRDTEEYEKAEACYREALAMRRKRLGSRHPDIAHSLNKLGVLLRIKGDYEQTEALYREALSIRREHLGDEHPEVAESLNNLATLHYRQGKHDEAERELQQALVMYEQGLGSDHPRVAPSAYNLAKMKEARGAYEEAKHYYQRALDIYRNALDETHPSVAASLYGLAGVLQAQGNYEVAESLLVTNFATLDSTLGIQHNSTQKALDRLIGLYEEWGKPEQAERYREVRSVE